MLTYTGTPSREAVEMCHFGFRGNRLHGDGRPSRISLHEVGRVPNGDVKLMRFVYSPGSGIGNSNVQR